MKQHQASYGNKGALLLQVLSETGWLFSIQDAYRVAEKLQWNTSYIPYLLHRLQKARLIKRLKRSQYKISTGPGNPTSHPFIIGMQLTSLCAVSGWSALHFYELTEQIPHVVTLSTPDRVATGVKKRSRQPGQIKIEHQSYEFIRVSPAHFFGYQEIWLEDTKVKIYEKERAVLDCFILLRRFGGLSTGLSLLDEWGASLDLEKLVQYALKYNAFSVIKRLGWSMEKVGMDKKIWHPLLTVSGQNYRLLDPTLLSKGPYDTKWQVRDNFSFSLGKTR